MRQFFLDPSRSALNRSMILTRLATGERMWIDPNDGMARYIFFEGLWEPHFIQFFRRLIRPGDTILDVGANAGQYTVVGAHATGKAGRVIAVEINSACVRLLERNASLCLPVRVDVVPIAAWSEECMLAVQQERQESSGLTSVRPTFPDAVEDHRVQARRLDVALSELGCRHVDLVKLDIEGAELPALQGLSGLLLGAPPRFIFCEIESDHCRRFGYEPSALFAFCASHGYRAFACCRADGQWISIEDFPPAAPVLNMFLFQHSTAESAIFA